jgi:hypothetical protein
MSNPGRLIQKETDKSASISMQTLNENDLQENVFTLEEVLALNYEENSVFKLDVTPSISEQIQQDEVEGAMKNPKLRVSRFIQIRKYEIAGDSMIVIVNDITDSINLKDSITKQKQEKARINYAHWRLEDSMNQLSIDTKILIKMQSERTGISGAT